MVEEAPAAAKSSPIALVPPPVNARCHKASVS